MLGKKMVTMNSTVKRRAFQLNRRRYYPSAFMGAAVFIAAVLAFLVHLGEMEAEDAIKLSVPAIAAIAGLVYFLYSQHLQETRLFVDLFRQFNERYDKHNDLLNEIFAQPQQDMLSAKQKQVLFDYFNLCSEEWLYFKTGYIDPAVWASWREGMKYFLDSAEIRRLWTEELERGSYYGLTIEQIEGY